VRLGIVLDRRGGADGVRSLAAMCERAGLDAVWLHDGEDGSGLGRRATRRSSRRPLA
jgi:hypothetical protein